MALPETPVIVKPTEVRDQAFGVDSDTSKDNGIAEYGSNDYKAMTVKVAVYATDGSDEHSKVNTDIAKLLGIPCKQEDGYYPIGVIEIPKSLVTGRTPYINTEEDWEAVKAAIEKIDTSWLTNNIRDNIDNVAGSKNKENTISKNLDKVQVDLKHEAGSHKTALFTWNGASQNIRGDYGYHLDLRFATVTLKFVGVIKGAPQNIDMGNRIYLTNTEILEPGTSDDFYLTGIPNGYQINGYYSDEDLDTVYTFDNKKATADDTIYVELVQKPVKITYNLNGGNLNGETESVVYNNLHVGDTMLTPNDPEREGYTFKGWKDKDGKSPSQQVTGDVTYTAQWEKIPDPEPAQSTDIYVYFRVVNTKDQNVSIDGLSVKYNGNAGGNTWCTFGKISTTKELTLDNVKTDAITQLRSENAQIHADNADIKDKVLSNVTWYQLGTWAGAPGYYDSGTYWHLDGKITGYTVTYNNGTTEATDAVHNMPDADEMYYLSGSEYTVSDATPTRTGYVFTGWKSNIENDTTIYNAKGKFEMPAKNVVLTAQWAEDNWKDADETTDPTDADSENGGDGIPDRYQVKILYVSDQTKGTVSPLEMEIKTIKDANNNFVSKGTVTATGSTATVTDASLYEFVKWTKDTNEVGTNAQLENYRITDAEGGHTYTFTANFKDKKIDPPTSEKAQYTVKHYKWDTQKKDYAFDSEETINSTVGAEVTATAKKYDDGYILNEQKSAQTMSGTVLKDNTLTLNLYYDIDKIGSGNNKDKPDGTPDRYQVTINYVSSNTNWGSVNRSKEVITLINTESGEWLETGTVIAPSCTATSAGGKCYFVNWTKKQEGTTDVSTVDSTANLPEQTIENAKGGDVYTFTANFDRSSGGGSGGSNRPKPPVVEIPDDVPTGLNGKDHYAYIIGYGNNDVRPQNNITRAEVATIFFRLLTDETREANMTKSNGYNDVKDGDWFCCAVSTLSKMGIIKGYEDGSFKPNAPISRAEFAAIAARFDPDGDKTPATFADVTSHWAKDEISIAANHGWIKGYEDGSFKPDQKITRAETMTLVNRVLNRLPETKDDLHKDMKTWVDNMDETAWYYLAVQEATNSHYFKNKTSTKFEQWTDLRDTRDWSELEK